MQILNYENVKTGNYVVIEQHGNDRFEEYFTTFEEAMRSAKNTYEHLTEKEKREIGVEVGIITRIDQDSFDWNTTFIY